MKPKDNIWKRKWTGVLSTLGCATSLFICGNGLYKGFQHSTQAISPSPLGLISGILAVGVAQVGIIFYQRIRRVVHFSCSEKSAVQNKPVAYKSTFASDVKNHLQHPELFLLIPYLSFTWMFNLMPSSYYDTSSPADVTGVVSQLLVVDLFTFLFHYTLHSLPRLYKSSHKAHHKFTNPQLFNAFDATIADTVSLILIPLFTTANICHVCCQSYIVFGVLYSSHFTLIHSEFEHSFDSLLRNFGVMTAADHHVHHAKFNYNYGHFFTIYDKLAGTYKDPCETKGFRRYDLLHQ